MLHHIHWAPLGMWALTGVPAKDRDDLFMSHEVTKGIIVQGRETMGLPHVHCTVCQSDFLPSHRSSAEPLGKLASTVQCTAGLQPSCFGEVQIIYMGRDEGGHKRLNPNARARALMVQGLT